MKDQVFTGRTVAEAVEVAGRTLGLAPDAIRYVVLEREAPGMLGIGGTPARIAVLLEGRGGAGAGGPVERRSAAPGRTERGDRAEREKPLELQARIRSFIRELAEVGELDLTAEVEEGEQRTVVRLFGVDRELMLERGAEALTALDHILQRAFGHDVHPRRLVVECEGFREARDNALGDRARELAAAVRADGRPRETEPLNSYERRIVHVALSEEPGIRTFSVGEGLDRRVTIAVRMPDDPPSPKEGTGGGVEG